MDRITALIESFAKEEEGAIITEYGMLVVVVVLGMAVMLVVFRDRVATWFNGIATDLDSI